MTTPLPVTGQQISWWVLAGPVTGVVTYVGPGGKVGPSRRYPEWPQVINYRSETGVEGFFLPRDFTAGCVA